MKDVYLGKPGFARLTIKSGAKVTLTVGVTGAGVPVDFTGYTFVSQVRTDTSKESPLLATIVVTAAPDPTLGILAMTVDATGLAEGEYEYDVRGQIDDEKPYILAGQLIVKGSATQDD